MLSVFPSGLVLFLSLRLLHLLFVAFCWLFAEQPDRAYHVRRLREVLVCIGSLGWRTHGDSEEMIMGQDSLG